MSAGPLAGALGPLAAVLGGAVLGVLVSHAVWWLVRVEGGATEDLPAAPRIRPAGIGAAVAFGLWWWEVATANELDGKSQRDAEKDEQQGRHGERQKEEHQMSNKMIENKDQKRMTAYSSFICSIFIFLKW